MLDSREDNHSNELGNKHSHPCLGCSWVKTCTRTCTTQCVGIPPYPSGIPWQPSCPSGNLSTLFPHVRKWFFPEKPRLVKKTGVKSSGWLLGAMIVKGTSHFLVAQSEWVLEHRGPLINQKCFYLKLNNQRCCNWKQTHTALLPTESKCLTVLGRVRPSSQSGDVLRTSQPNSPNPHCQLHFWLNWFP